MKNRKGKDLFMKKKIRLITGFGRHMSKSNVNAFASSSAYFMFLSIIPIIILLFRRFYHIKLPGVIGNTLTWIGQASYHIFLVQMVYYHFELGGRLMASTWYIALPFNILVTVAAGLAFYEADCRFIRNMKYLKFKAKRRVA